MRSKRKKERRRKREELREVEKEEDGQGRRGWGKALTLVKKNRTPVKTVMISPASLYSSIHSSNRLSETRSCWDA